MVVFSIANVSRRVGAKRRDRATFFAQQSQHAFHELGGISLPTMLGRGFDVRNDDAISVGAIRGKTHHLATAQELEPAEVHVLDHSWPVVG